MDRFIVVSRGDFVVQVLGLVKAYSIFAAGNFFRSGVRDPLRALRVVPDPVDYEGDFEEDYLFNQGLDLSEDSDQEKDVLMFQLLKWQLRWARDEKNRSGKLRCQKIENFLELLFLGHTYEEIAREIGVSKNTVVSWADYVERHTEENTNRAAGQLEAEARDIRVRDALERRARVRERVLGVGA